MAGLTPDGLLIRTQPELVGLLKATLVAAFPGVDFDNGPEGAVVTELGSLLAEPWETLQAIVGALQGRGAGIVADWFAAITGTLRRTATRSRVAATVNLDAGKTIPAGKVVSVDGDPDSQFRLVAAVTNSGGSAADFAAIFESVKTGPIAAPATKLTVITTPVTGWNSVTNAGAAVKGRLVADDVELAAARVVELASRGNDSYAAIEARVSKVVVLVAADASAKAYGNETLGVVAGRPGKSVEVVVWDNALAADADIAQAIYNSKGAGIQAYGTTSATAKTKGGADFPLGFTRATVLRTYVAVTLVGCTASAAQIKQAIVDRGALFAVGELGAFDELVQALRNALPATIGRITALTIGTGPTPVTALVTPTYAQIIRILTGDIAVTGAS